MLPPLRASLVLISWSGLTAIVEAQSSRHGPVALVSGNVVTSLEVRDAVAVEEQMLRFQFANDPATLERELAALKATALDSLIDRELILAEFKRLGMSMKPQWVDNDVDGIIRERYKGSREAFIKDLSSSGMSLRRFREQREKNMIVQAMRARQAARQPPATPREVEEFYHKNLDLWREGGRIKISTITIPKYSGEPGSTAEGQRKKIDEIRAQIVGGEDFAAAARAHSQDVYADNGGARDWMPRDQIPPVIANAAFALKAGGVSPILESEGNYLLIGCDAIQPGKAKPLSELRAQIEQAVAMEKSRAVLDRWMEELRKRAIIKKFH